MSDLIKCINKPKNMDFKFDPNSTKNEGRWRLKDPKHFIKYFRKKVWEDVPFKEGVSYVIGISKTGKLDVQAIRFNKAIISEELAAQWWLENNSYFEKEWIWNKYQLMNM